MQTIDTQTLHDLEFTTIQNWLAEFAIGPTAKNRLEQLSPIKELHLIRPTLGKLKEFPLLLIILSQSNYVPKDFPDKYLL